MALQPEPFWSQLSTAQKLADCYNLSMTRPMADSLAPAPVNVTFNRQVGVFQKGEVAALPSDEASKVVNAGFASYV